MITPISDEKINKIRYASVHSLSTRPGEDGRKEEDVKNAMFDPTKMLIDEVNRIVEEVEVDNKERDAKVDALEDTTHETDNTTTLIEYTIEDNVCKSFMANNIGSVELTIPEDFTVGNSAEVSFKTGDTAPTLSVVNNTRKTIKRVQYGGTISNYIPTSNALVKILFDCSDDLYVMMWIVEVR